MAYMFCPHCGEEIMPRLAEAQEGYRQARSRAMYDAILELQEELRGKYAEYTTEAVPVLLLRAMEGCDALKTYLEG